MECVGKLFIVSVFVGVVQRGNSEVAGLGVPRAVATQIIAYRANLIFLSLSSKVF